MAEEPKYGSGGGIRFAQVRHYAVKELPVLRVEGPSAVAESFQNFFRMLRCQHAVYIVNLR
jgi:hypothetical protein